MKARFIEVIGTRVNISSSWTDSSNKCSDESGYHRGDIFYMDSDRNLSLDEIPDSAWLNIKCSTCGLASPKDGRKGLGNIKRYNTDSGKAEPGDLYWSTSYHDSIDKCYIWDNCTGPHLTGVLPNGHHWDIDSRCSNCTRPDDKTHRCWVRHGEVPNIHVDKNGDTCSAGAGSIFSGNWHGFLHNGEFK